MGVEIGWGFDAERGILRPIGWAKHEKILEDGVHQGQARHVRHQANALLGGAQLPRRTKVLIPEAEAVAAEEEERKQRMGRIEQGEWQLKRRGCVLCLGYFVGN